MQKYNRTYHLPFSQEVHDDDKTIETLADLIGYEVVITEKLDGGNTCLFENKVFARSHSGETTHGSFSMVRALASSLFYLGLFPSNLKIFGENMQGIHSIEYSQLSSPFYLFNIYDVENKIWLSWDDVVFFSEKSKLPSVPLVFRGIFKNEKELEKFINNEMKKESALGGEREGLVIRRVESFNNECFETYVSKCVRKGHVQTDEHWSKNWKQADIDPKFLTNILKEIK